MKRILSKLFWSNSFAISSAILFWVVVLLFAW
jgi:hypothetical protein